MIPFLDLRIDDTHELNQHVDSFKHILMQGPLISGDSVEELENRVKNLIGRKHAIAVNSGTSALFLALRALSIGPGDEVIVPCLSWIATANAVSLTGAKPVFADIGDDLNICCKSIERLITPSVKAIIAVDYTGKAANYDEIMPLAESHSIPVIEDAAQAFGATHNSLKCGAFGKISCFSLNPVKVFGGLGEGGIILTDEDFIAEELEVLRNSGLINRTWLRTPSFNSRMDTIHAAFLINRLGTVTNKIRQRQIRAARYNESLDNTITRPSLSQTDTHSYYTYTIQTNSRDELQIYLKNNGVETQVQHRVLMCEQGFYQEFRQEKTNATMIKDKILCLPIHEKLSLQDQEIVISHVNNFARR